ncbi:hypothetical protein [Legionella impletisoli]|uniref:Uncharacterized protein n=1 Tax=Legionella impletisoli TaxID=343510 RepID=A0A917NEP3_9GAMM|nr:hypothetical protein [Legionella impletisoli]GGI90566.1 hypothetical protein GCM10007966_19110 [Legionella impletisoli]
MSNHNIKVGTIFYACWGYEQTNINFYEVIELVGKCTLVLQELKQTRTPCSYLSGNTKPVPSSYIGSPFRKRINRDGLVKISSCELGTIWDGRTLSYSQYA